MACLPHDDPLPYALPIAAAAQAAGCSERTVSRARQSARQGRPPTGRPGRPGGPQHPAIARLQRDLARIARAARAMLRAQRQARAEDLNALDALLAEHPARAISAWAERHWWADGWAAWQARHRGEPLPRSALVWELDRTLARDLAREVRRLTCEVWDREAIRLRQHVLASIGRAGQRALRQLAPGDRIRQQEAAQILSAAQAAWAIRPGHLPVVCLGGPSGVPSAAAWAAARQARWGAAGPWTPWTPAKARQSQRRLLAAGGRRWAAEQGAGNPALEVMRDLEVALPQAVRRGGIWRASATGPVQLDGR